MPLLATDPRRVPQMAVVPRIVPFPASTRSFPVLLDFPAKRVRDRHLVIKTPRSRGERKFFGRPYPPRELRMRCLSASRLGGVSPEPPPARCASSGPGQPDRQRPAQRGLGSGCRLSQHHAAQLAIVGVILYRPSPCPKSTHPIPLTLDRRCPMLAFSIVPVAETSVAGQSRLPRIVPSGCDTEKEER